MNTSIDIESINSIVEETLNLEINEELFINLYKAQNLLGTETNNQNQLTKLLKNEVSEYTLSKHGGKISFDEFIFINTIGFKPEKEGKFELTYTNLTGQFKQKTNDTLNSEDRIFFNVNESVAEFSISYEKINIFSSKKIKISNLRIMGLNLHDFNQQINYLSNLYDDRTEFVQKIEDLKTIIRQNAEKLNQQKVDLDSYIQEKNEYIETLNNGIENLEENKETLRIAVQNLNADKESLESKILAKNTELERLTINNENFKKVNEAIDKDITKLNARKEELSTEVNLVPDNLIGFNKRTKEAKETYYRLSAIPILILSILFICAWINITKLSSAEGIKTLEEAYVLLLQRLPLTLLIITIVSILMAFLYKMLRHLMEIQQQELSLSKISVLARDVSDSEFNEHNEEKKQQDRIKRKMELIRDFFNSEFKRYQEFMKNEQSDDLMKSTNIQSQLRNLLKSKK
ncbi:hypothetical protein [Acinetobacter terrae]|uniref:Uncharacterized protein n=1 Tax=Acinetobacter terrae TaxID=2731247 RepID=A0A8E4GL30_9GAMM|nr:hypothetical protein [Acinetobacter terrae]NNH37940.1 hypothetical protein [Acinetobacter terrae]